MKNLFKKRRISNLVFCTALFIISGCTSSDDPTNEPDLICDCQDNSVSTRFDEVEGSWRLIRRTKLDSIGENITEIEEIEDLEPISLGSLSFRIYTDESGVRKIEKPVGALLGGTWVYDYKYTIVKIIYPIIYFKDGSNCIKTVTQSPNAGFRLCILEYNQNYIKIKQKWSQHYVIYEGYRE
ncbi:hypothetical protein [Flavobacterium sp.]|uniref:hypothetical protein n=1 Tax=Flavobacterium sp. TaxID=239 RepID=UPI00262F0AC4|nr:hypothetical protein [Flavobacterium sp.]MDD2986407.1 hypothetical protein [Flavobacterium sp.]